VIDDLTGGPEAWDVERVNGHPVIDPRP